MLVSARRDALGAGFRLLAAMGRAEARDLGLDGGVLYDPAINYDRVKGRIWDWDEDPAPTPQSTSTVDTPAQSSKVGPLTTEQGWDDGGLGQETLEGGYTFFYQAHLRGRKRNGCDGRGERNHA